MSAILYGFDYITAALRGGLFAFAVVVGIFCALDWMVRTRRLNPFGPVARFLRSTIRPLIVPVERRILRSGGNPQNAPWWTLAGVILGGIILLSLLDFVRDQIIFASALLSSGPAGLYKLVVSWAFAVLRLALIVRVLLSWMHPSPFAWYVRWSYALTEWFLRPMRGIIPLIGMIDITPILAYFLLGLVQTFLVRLA
ncbi:MAG TPA: YggT family protein [Gemmatimonadaceae bacterium]